MGKQKLSKKELRDFLKYCAGHDVYYGNFSAKVSVLRKIRKKASNILSRLENEKK